MKVEILFWFDDVVFVVDSLCFVICEVYDVVLKLNSIELNSIIGCGEVYMAFAVLFCWSGDYVRVDEVFDMVWKVYDKVFKFGDKNDLGMCEEWFEVVYNAACAANRAG